MERPPSPGLTRDEVRFAAALATLPAREQQAIILHVRERLSYDVVSHRLGLTGPVEARVVVHRALGHLAQVLSDRGSRPNRPEQASLIGSALAHVRRWFSRQ